MTNLGMAKIGSPHRKEVSQPPGLAAQDYLRAIYKLSRRSPDGLVQTNQVAEMLGVRPASVTGMLQKLATAEPPLVKYLKYQGVRLSPAGQAEALSIVRRHRLVELYLHEKLGYSWDEVHEEADRLEHVVSDDFIDRLVEVLEDPALDPHGHAIPRADLSLDTIEVLPLIELPPQISAQVSSVRDDEAAALRALAQAGLVPGAEIMLLNSLSANDFITLAVTGRDEPVEITGKIAGLVFVRITSRSQA